ncbi:unnamed protein product [Mycena citricolor]|uniref:OPT oligopeptide transporter n=1 Tax=Mycena citricolor TaxID=2018698 RepID=A0AAD2HVL0_9AGAR|nr:unnamed protein product [Mycena citricolor]
MQESEGMGVSESPSFRCLHSCTPAAWSSLLPMAEKEINEKDSVRSSSLGEKGGVLADIEVLATEIQAVPDDILEASEYAKTMSAEEIEETIKLIVKEHGDDPNFPRTVIEAANRYLYDPELRQDPVEFQRVYEELKVEAAMMNVNSAYAEVRAVVSNKDDPTTPVLTFRTWVIGTIFVGAGGFINQFFSIRFPGISVGSNVAQVLAYPFAKLLELLPAREFTTFGYTWTLNPGPFNPKEHMIITIMANVGFSTPYTYVPSLVKFVPSHSSFCASARASYGSSICLCISISHGRLILDIKVRRMMAVQKTSLIRTAVLTALSTNLIGYGLAGLTRRFLVYPASAVWYNNLSIIALNRAFHHEKATVANGWSMTRMRWFLYCFGSMFVYFWFPDYIFQALSYFNWITWIAPNNVHLAAITGSVSGLGLNPIPTFDWNQLTYFLDPLINPFYVSFPRNARQLELIVICSDHNECELLAGVLMTTNITIDLCKRLSLGWTMITFPVIVAIWYTNTWNTGYLPINSNRVFDNTGNFYNVSRAVGPDTLFDAQLYDNYSPAYLAAANIIIYGVFFAVYTATLSHAILYHRRDMLHGFKSILSFGRKTSDMHRDVHVRLMEQYKEVGEWQYFMILVAAIGLGAAGVGAYATETSPAVVLYGVFLAAIFVIPIGIIYSITNVQITLNVLAELFGGLWFPGNAVAMNYFKSYGYVTTAHTLNFAQDLKLAHYMHIPPVATFWAQIYATVVSSFICTAILNFQMTKIPDVCTPHQVDHFICPGINTFFTASVLWGTLGPKRMFGQGGIYNSLLYCFLIGAALPIPFYFLRKRFRSLEHVHLPVIIYGGLIWAPGSIANIWPAVPVAWLFNVFIKKRYLAWWGKYNYITTTAFSAAIAISAIVIFFAVQWPNVVIDWSGNNRPFEGCDANGCTRLTVPVNGTFGPAVGEFH